MAKPKLTIEEVMIDIPNHPDLLKTVDGEFPHYMMRRDGFYHCGVCGKRFGKVMSQLLIGNTGHCPSCHSEITLKHISRRTNWDNLITEHRIRVMQVYQGRIAFRQYEAVHSVDRNDLKEKIEVNEIQRDTVYKGQLSHCMLRTWNRSTQLWTWGWINEIYDRSRRPKQYFYMYPKSMEEVLRDSEVKFTGVGKYIDDHFDESQKTWYSERLIANAAYAPWVEYVMKMKLNNLYSDIINGHANMIYIRPNLIKRYRQFIKDNDASAALVTKKRMFEIMGVNPSLELLNRIETSDIKPLSKFAKRLGTSIDKVSKYLKDSCNQSIQYQYYEDYLDMLDQIGTPATTESTMFPDDLRKAHDDAVVKINTIKQEENNSEYAKHYPNYAHLNYTNNGLMMVVPKDVVEIIMEGKELNHCVGSYVDRVAKGETVILFIRHADSPLEAFYTMEYKNGKIIQVRGKHNDRPTKEVSEFTQEWLEWTKKPKKKTKKLKQPVMQLQAVNA